MAQAVTADQIVTDGALTGKEVDVSASRQKHPGAVREWIQGMFNHDIKEFTRLEGIVRQINALEPEVAALTDAGLRAKTDDFRQVIADALNALHQADGWDKRSSPEQKEAEDRATEEALDRILPEAFAVVREAAGRSIGQRHFDVQLLAGIVMQEGGIAEMLTGEGKTLAATLSLYLRSLAGRGTHLLTSNDDLARQGALTMSPIFHFLGLTVGLVESNLAGMPSADSSVIDSPERGKAYTFAPEARLPHLRRNPEIPGFVEVDRSVAYDCDVVYSTGPEVVFDYLHDNLVMKPYQIRLKELYFAIVDEADSVLIDNATDPFILNIPVESDKSVYTRVYDEILKLNGAECEKEDETTHYIVDRREMSIVLTDEGVTALERLLDVENLALDPHLYRTVNACLRAREFHHRDQQYIVQNGQVIIVSPYTGYPEPGRRYANGIHQALEAKEGVEIRDETITIASTTYQSFFRMYERLSGMTGTGKCAEGEFYNVYHLRVTEIPTNRPMIRRDHEDARFDTMEKKDRGIILEVIARNARCQPLLMGTRNVDRSEHYLRRLQSENVQKLVMISLISSSSAEMGGMAQELSESLERPLEQIPMDELQSAMQDFGFSPDPCEKENLVRLASNILGLEPDEKTLTRLAGIISEGIQAPVINAKEHKNARQIIRHAGEAGSVVIATNMAGRGVDIELAGSVASEAEKKWVEDLGGLYVLGTERHESRRIDNQLRGRAGRQGDRGESKFFVSREDELFQPFSGLFRSNEAGTRQGFFGRISDEFFAAGARIMAASPEGIEKVQQIIQDNNLARRQHLLQYDEVINLQCRIIYADRRKILFERDLRPTILAHLNGIIDSMLDVADLSSGIEAPGIEGSGETEDKDVLESLYDRLGTYFDISSLISLEDLRAATPEELGPLLHRITEEAYSGKEQQLMESGESPRSLEQETALGLIDWLLSEHLMELDELQENVELRAWVSHGQENPFILFQTEAYQLFERLKTSIVDSLVHHMFDMKLPG